MWICGFGYDADSGEYVLADNLCTTCDGADDITLTDRVYDGSPSADLHMLTRWDIINDMRPGKTDRLGRTYTSVSRVATYIGRKLRNYAGRPLYDRYIRLPKSDSGTEMFSVDGNFVGDRYLYPDDLVEFRGDYMPSLDSVRTKIRFLSVSDSYDKYLSFLLYMRGKKENPPSEADLVDLYMRDNLPTNIVGGTGIFGAASMQEFPYCKDGMKLDEDNVELISEYDYYTTHLGDYDVIIEYIYPEHYFEYVCNHYVRDEKLDYCTDPLRPSETMNPIEGSPWAY